jgi:predicted nucleotidyltransferase
MMNKNAILKVLDGVRKEVKKKYKADIKGIFGSYVRGDNKKESDIDVLVDFEEAADLFDLVGLSYFLENELHCNVDIVPLRALREEIKPYIMKEMLYL